MPVWLAVAGAIVVAGTAVMIAINAGPFASPLGQLWVLAAGIELWQTRDQRAHQPARDRVVTRTGEAPSR